MAAIAWFFARRTREARYGNVPLEAPEGGDSSYGVTRSTNQASKLSVQEPVREIPENGQQDPELAAKGEPQELSAVMSGHNDVFPMENAKLENHVNED